MGYYLLKMKKARNPFNFPKNDCVAAGSSLFDGKLELVFAIQVHDFVTESGFLDRLFEVT